MFDPRKFNIGVRLSDEPEEQLYCATVRELPDVVIYEATAAAAYESILIVISDLKALFTKKGKAFPDAMPPQGEPSGRTTLRMSKTLHRRVSFAAETDDISLNQWIVEAVAWRLNGAKTSPTVVAPNAISMNYDFGKARVEINSLPKMPATIIYTGIPLQIEGVSRDTACV